MAKTGDPSVLRLVVVFLRFLADQSQTEFGKASRVAQTEVSKYEMGKQTPTEEALRRMAKAAGVSWPVVVHLRRFFGAVLATTRRSSAEEDVAGPDWSLLEPALLAVSPYLVKELAPEPRSLEDDRREAEEIWSALEPFPMAYRRRLIELFPRASWNWVLAITVCEASVRAAPHEARESLDLADLALWISGRVSGEERRSRVQGYCWGYLANARRVATDFDGADEAFATAWNLWQAGAAFNSELLPEWRLLDLEASLRREQHRFPQALELLDRAMTLSGGKPVAAARILLKKEHIFDQVGDARGALAVLAEAAVFVDASRDPYLLFALRFKTANNLCHLGRYEEAAGLVPQVRELAEQQGNELNLLRVLWLEARIAAGLGRAEDAMAGLEQVRRDFTARGLPYEAALSSLELAALWLETGRTSEVRELAVAMAWIFKAKGIQREALAALQLFRDAAERDAVTVELTRRVMEEMRRGRG